jgi:hypothetical protein
LPHLGEYGCIITFFTACGNRPCACGSSVDVDLTADIVRAGVNYRVDLPFLSRF